MLLTIDVGNTHTVMGVWERMGATEENAVACLSDRAKVREANKCSVEMDENADIRSSDFASDTCVSERVGVAGDEPACTPCPFPWQKVCGWRLSTVKSCTADEIVINVSTLFASQDLDASKITGAIMCSVVPRLSANWSCAVRDMLGVELQFCTTEAVGSAFKCSYPTPHEIGMDYIADALGAVHLYGSPVVVFDFGTATNVSIVDKSGTFKGGIIAPGVETGAAALFSKATQLTSVALRAPEHVVGQSTDECIRAGVVLGEAARVDGLSAMIFDELGYSAPVIATGGLAGAVGQRSRTITLVNPELTLQGLCVAYDELSK